MAQSTLTADRSAMLAFSGSLNLAGGQDLHLATILSASGYDLRAVIGFTIPAAFWTPMRKITKVELRLTGEGSGAHIAIGASPSAVVRRAISQWTANSAGESWTTSPTVYPGPSYTTTGQVTRSLPGSGVTSFIDITDIGVAWAPNSVKGPTGLPGGGAVCYGVGLLETGGSAQGWQGHSAKASSSSVRPQLRFTYETNSPPNPPTLIYPLGPDQAAGRFEAQTIDLEGDAITSYDLQLSTDSTFTTVTHWNVVNSTTGLTGAKVERNYVGDGAVPMTVGDRYYWRCRMADAGSATDSPWSSIGTFVKAAGSGTTGDMYDLWIDAVLSDMAEGRTVLRVGTLRPVAEQVAALVCAEYGDLFQVAWDETLPPVDELVYILGQRVSLSPDGWTVDAVVELKREVG